MSYCPQNSYFICATPRTGSFLLCEILTKTGILGRPNEYFREESYSSLFERGNVSTFRDYLPKLLKITATNGVFGAKLMGSDYFSKFVKRLRQLPAYQNQDISDSEIIAKIFPNVKYIWLTRRSKIRQAISLSKAQQTRIWHSAHTRHSTHTPNIPIEPIYSVEDINRSLLTLIKQDETWQKYFTEAGIKPLTLVYEDFTQSPEQTVRCILDYLGIPAPQDLACGKIVIKKQADSTSEIWVEKYFKYIQDFQTLERKQLLTTTNRATAEDIARRIPIKNIIGTIGFKIANKLHLKR